MLHDYRAGISTHTVMARDELTPEVVALFEGYQVQHRDVFLEEIVRFVHSYGCTRHELMEIRTALRARKEALVHMPRKRGRPRGSKRWLSGDKAVQEDDLSMLDPHSGFRETWVLCGDVSHRRPLLLKRAILFIGSATRSELAQIRRAVAMRAEKAWHKRRGRPDALDDEELMSKARQVAWMRCVQGKTWKDVRTAILPPHSADETALSPRRLQDYLAAVIYKALPPEYIIHVGPGRFEINSEAWEDKLFQSYVGFRTGLPFRTHPVECRKIISKLWPRAFSVSWKRIESHLRHKQTK